MLNTEGGSRKIIETAVEANENGDIGLHWSLQNTLS